MRSSRTNAKVSGDTKGAGSSQISLGIKQRKTGTSVEQLWNEVGVRLNMLQSKDIKAILVGFEGRACVHLLNQLREIGVGQTASIASIDGLRTHNNLWNSFELILVNHDAFDDASDAVETLIEFRKRVPGKRIILISSQVNRDDFGPERRPICDVTLKAPGTIERLGASLNL